MPAQQKATQILIAKIVNIRFYLIKALGGYYDFSLKDALRNNQLTVQLSFPSGSTTKEIDLHSQLEQVLKNSELPDGWYILNQNNDFPKEVHIDDNQIRIN